MIRHVAAALFAVCVSPSWLCAQTTTFTVNVSSADVYKAPSTGSPVIGHAPRGAMLPVMRDLGSWVKVPWAGAQDGMAYVHMTAGSIARSAVGEASRTGSSAATSSAVRAGSSTGSVQSEVDRTAARVQSTAPRPVFVAPASHIVGLGGRMGASTFGWGATARAWRRNRLGVQLDVSRYVLAGSALPGRLTTVQIEPSVLYSLPNRMSDYVWLRPYLGSGVSLHRQSFASIGGALGSSGAPASSTGVGLQAFGGGELTFAGLPQFSLSADLSYRWAKRPFPEFETDGPGVSILAHWYVK
jgi:hypothetical protein